MQDPVLVDVLEAVQRRERPGARLRIGPLVVQLQTIAESTPAQALHDQRAHIGLDVVGNADDVRVVERRQQTGLSREPLTRRAVSDEFLGQDLDGHVPAQPDVCRRIHRAERPSPQDAVDLVRG